MTDATPNRLGPAPADAEPAKRGAHAAAAGPAPTVARAGDAAAGGDGSEARTAGNPPAPAQAAPQQGSPRQGFWSRLLALLGSSDDPEKVKRRLLKAIEREVARERVPYYLPRSDSAGPALGKLFHAFYCTFGPARTLLESAGSSETLRTIVIESRLGPEEIEIRDALTEEAITALAGSTDARRLSDQVRASLSRFTSLYAPRAAAINAHVRDFSVLLDLVSFDYYAALRKLDPSIPQGNYAYVPAFAPANAEYIVGDLRDLAEILAVVDPAAEWDSLFDTLKEYRRMEAVSREAWRRLLQTIQRLSRSNLVSNLIRLMEHDPHASVVPRSYGRDCAAEYVEKVRMQAELALQRMVSQKRTAKIAEMIGKTFGRAPEQRLSHYVAAVNPGFEKRGAAGYTYAGPLNFLRVYLSDHLPGEVKSIADLALVKGRWASPLTSHTLSDCLQTALKIALQLAEFDESLADDGARGQKVKAALVKAGRNKKDAYVLRQTVRLVNDSARSLLASGVETLVALGKMLKTLLDDCSADEPRLLLNWRELDAMAESQLKSRLVAAYTRLYNLVQLLGQYREARTG